MLLAAGLGTRLRPLTLTTPKPMLPLGGARLIDYTLGYLGKAGVEAVMINLHHLGDQIADYVGDGSRFGIKAHYSEEPEILGTGGGIKKVEGFFGDEPFIALNGDALLDVDAANLIKRHDESGAGATMVLKPLAPEDSYQPVSVEGGFVTGFNGEGNHFYVGLQILTHKLLEKLPPAGTASCLVKDGYKPFLEEGGRIAALTYDGYFNDVGTPERYSQAKRDAETNVISL